MEMVIPEVITVWITPHMAVVDQRGTKQMFWDWESSYGDAAYGCESHAEAVEAIKRLHTPNAPFMRGRTYTIVDKPLVA